MTETAIPARKPGDHPFEAVHADERDWETQRFGGYQSKMLFHPRPERPTEPNAGLIRFAPGASHPVHRHDFAQIWYILEGEFVIDGRNYGPGTMVFHPDPHYEAEMRTETGGLWLLVQYPGPSTGKPPIYDGRFNLEKRKPLAEERLDL
jgi:mannose-6-phosphate isomerase-like protein (cupin superfamily)